MPDYDPAPAFSSAPPPPMVGGGGSFLGDVLSGLGQLSTTAFPWFQELNRHEETELSTRAQRAIQLAAVQRGSFVSPGSGLNIGGALSSVGPWLAPAALVALLLMVLRR